MKKNALLAAAIILLAGCNGGGSDPAPTSTSSTTTSATTAEGMWAGTTNTNRVFKGFVLDDGSFWFLYSGVGNNNILAGGVQGSSSASNGSFISSDAKDFNIEGLGISPATVSGNYSEKQSLNGSVSYPGQSQSVIFTSTYSASYDATALLSVLAGTYSGTGAVANGKEAATITIASSGAISGSSASGCRFSGIATPRSHGNIYNVSVTFGGGVCSNGNSTVTGIGYYDPAAKRLWSAALNSARDNGFIFVGAKP